MANLQKFKGPAVSSILRHNERTLPHDHNPDLDPTRSHLNESLLPPDGLTGMERYRRRLAEVHFVHRKTLVMLASWVVTAPAELRTRAQERRFFRAVTDFLLERYGRDNAVQAIVHRDEAGRPHLHFAFLPVVTDRTKLNPDGSPWKKICAYELLTPFELQHFHGDLQAYLLRCGIVCTVHSGITAQAGGSLSPEEMKIARRILRLYCEEEIHYSNERSTKW